MWYLASQFGKLAPGVRRAFDEAVSGDRTIWIPAVVLWEMSLLVKLGKIRLTVSIQDYIDQRFFAQGLHTTDLLAEDVALSHQLHFTSDPWDTMIVATALRLDCPLITKDAVIHREEPCSIYWG
ncbi:MAG: type II toxin-antitoxin system VapC family toxin [Candidatus Eremiobacteraeota bacterium]|nr:type II toxin-antitoxin system VapC family toxin [Candidatus Eremiobacteraeota bacterium]